MFEAAARGQLATAADALVTKHPWGSEARRDTMHT